ncbi:MAG: sulfurtransferase [Chloroflexi bacterium]|nr:sulfurtransferase [Chloroflexota bacterium]
MPRYITPSDLNDLLGENATLALVDVREQGEYNEAHIPGSTCLPRRLLEFRMREMTPFLGTRVMVCDDDGPRADLASVTLDRMGYPEVLVLKGGIDRWASEGYPTEWGTNVLSKDFGEKVQVQQKVPEIGPEELNDWLQKGKGVILLDSRTPEEHQQFCIPGSRSVPGGELALRIWDIVGDSQTPVVVHCAGRTRSIIGAGTLQRLGLPTVYGLRNGTMGWQLAGLELETGSLKTEISPVSPEGLSKAEAFARKVAMEDGVAYLDIQGLQGLMARADGENVYLIDVRTSEEFTGGHIPGFRWYPGGQAVQQSDDVAAVKNGQIVFCCDGVVRASVTGSWFRQMGFPNVYAVDGGTSKWSAQDLPLERGTPPAEPSGYRDARAEVEMVSPPELKKALETSQQVVIFVDTSRDFAGGHVPGARWTPRGWLEMWIEETASSKDSAVVVTCTDGLGSVLAGATLRGLGYRKVSVLDGGMEAWRDSGLPIEKGLTGVMAPPTDLISIGAGRNFAQAINYLRWEEELGRKYETEPG